MYILYIMHTMKYTHFIKKEEHCRIIYDYITFISICLHDSPTGAMTPVCLTYSSQRNSRGALLSSH